MGCLFRIGSMVGGLLAKDFRREFTWRAGATFPALAPGDVEMTASVISRSGRRRRSLGEAGLLGDGVFLMEERVTPSGMAKAGFGEEIARGNGGKVFCGSGASFSLLCCCLSGDCAIGEAGGVAGSTSTKIAQLSESNEFRCILRDKEKGTRGYRDSKSNVKQCCGEVGRGWTKC